MSARYVIRPKADRDLDEQAYYLATEAKPEAGYRFLLAAHETFNLLAAQPQMGWRWGRFRLHIVDASAKIKNLGCSLRC